jgi:preprotein translocase subunit YajC
MNDVEAGQYLMAMNESGGGDLFNMLFLMGGLGLILYFTMIRPQANERKKHEALLTGLTKGTKVVTTSGLHGKISEVATATVVIEIAPKTLITIEKTAVARLLVEPDEQAASK